MSDKQSVTGQCLCGEVKLNATKASNKLHACHCGMCRRWGGGPVMAVDCETEVEIQGKENIATFGSSEWAERGFCTKCGTHLFYRLKESGQYIVPIGLLDGLEEVDFEGQLFVEEKPEYYDFSNKTQMITGEQLFAMFQDQQH